MLKEEDCDAQTAPASLGVRCLDIFCKLDTVIRSCKRIKVESTYICNSVYNYDNNFVYHFVQTAQANHIRSCWRISSEKALDNLFITQFKIYDY